MWISQANIKFSPQLCSLNDEDPDQEVDVEDDDDDYGDTEEPVAVTLVHPAVIVLRIRIRKCQGGCKKKWQPNNLVVLRKES